MFTKMTSIFLALIFNVLLCSIFCEDAYGDEFVHQLWGEKMFSVEKHRVK